MPKVFISYSHDCHKHRQQVLALADRLNENDIDCELDQRINGSPSEGWPLWMERMLKESTYSLVIFPRCFTGDTANANDSHKLMK